MNLLCNHCDVYVGYGGVGVVLPPENKDEYWLSTHCWVCGRSNEEVIRENEKRAGVGGNNAR